MILLADSEAPDRNAQMRRLIWAFTVRICPKTRIHMAQPIIEPAQHQTYNKTCMTSKDSDQPVAPPSVARVLVHPTIDSPEAVEGTCDQRRL